MLKKIVLGISLVGVLATSSFGEETKLKSSFWEQRIDQNFCIAYNYYNYQKFVYINDDYNFGNNKIANLAVHKQSIKDTGDKFYTMKNGALSTDFLKENGIGYSVNINWGNIVLAFDDFFRESSKEDLKELSRFMMLLNYYSGNFTLDSRVTEKENKELFLLGLIKEEYYSYKNGTEYKNSIFILTDYFANLKNKKQKELYGPFAKYVINQDFKRAREYIKSSNKKTGINSIYQRFENACEK